MSMMIGDIMIATVIDVQRYGIWLQREGQRGLLMIIDLTWEDRPVSPTEFAQVGDELEILVKRLPGLEDCHFIASLKDLHPEQNPWRDPSPFAPGTHFNATVTSIASYGYFVRHPNGAKGLIHNSNVDRPLSLGDELEVEVESYDPELYKLLLKPIRTKTKQ